MKRKSEGGNRKRTGGKEKRKKGRERRGERREREKLREKERKGKSNKEKNNNNRIHKLKQCKSRNQNARRKIFDPSLRTGGGDLNATKNSRHCDSLPF